MKKFLKYMAIFLGICILIVVAIELLLLSQTNEYSYKKEYVEKHLSDLEILIMGNSHFAYSVKPELIGNHCFNMAISGQNKKYTVEIAKKYIPQMANLKCVFALLDYSDFYFGRQTWNPNNKNKPSGLDNTYKCMYYKYMDLRVDNLYYWSEFYHSKLDFLKRFFKSEDEKREVDTLGWLELKLENRIKDWNTAFMPSVIDTNKPVDTVAFNNLWNNFTTLAELTKKQNARLILIGTPMHKNAQKELNPQVLAEMKNFVETLKSKYENVEYYDFTFDARFVDDDFWDTSHIGAEGAPKFSKMLREIVEK